MSRGHTVEIIRDQDRLRLISRGGYDWADRFPRIAAAALKLEHESFVIDGEVVVLGPDGISDFDALASRKYDKRAQLYARSTCSLGTARTFVYSLLRRFCSL